MLEIFYIFGRIFLYTVNADLFGTSAGYFHQFEERYYCTTRFRDTFLLNENRKILNLASRKRTYGACSKITFPQIGTK